MQWSAVHIFRSEKQGYEVFELSNLLVIAVFQAI